MGASSRCNQMAKEKKSKQHERRQIFSAAGATLDQLFPLGWIQQLGMDGIIIHKHTKAAVQVHISTQAERNVDKHRQIYPVKQTNTQIQTKLFVRSWLWNKSAKEEKLKDKFLSVYCLFLQLCWQHVNKTCKQMAVPFSYQHKCGKKKTHIHLNILYILEKVIFFQVEPFGTS